MRGVLSDYCLGRELSRIGVCYTSRMGRAERNQNRFRPAVIGLLLAVTVGVSFPPVRPVEAATNRFIVRSPIDLTQINRISKFRSCVDQDFSGYNVNTQRERSRSMRHYLEPVEALRNSTNQVKVFAPVAGTITRIANESSRGKQIWISTTDREADWSVLFFHVNVLSKWKKGSRVRAGQLIGYANLRNGRSFEIAVQQITSRGRVLDSLAARLSTAVASKFSGEGLTSASTVVSRTARNAAPCDFSQPTLKDWKYLKGHAPTVEEAASVTWSFNGSDWQPDEPAPTCPEPFAVALPVDLAKASSALYPGQVRSGQYKPHGGFRLDGTAYDAVIITAPFDAYVVDGSRHYENGEIQYYFDFVHPCGIRYRLDHLHTLSPTFVALADQLPAPAQGSESYLVTPTLIPAGTVIATAVGHPDNVGFDLGVYDSRQRNEASQRDDFRTAHPDMVSNAYFAVCWFDWLSAADEAAVRALPAADGISGTTSDYCE